MSKTQLKVLWVGILIILVMLILASVAMLWGIRTAVSLIVITIATLAACFVLVLVVAQELVGEHDNSTGGLALAKCGSIFFAYLIFLSAVRHAKMQQQYFAAIMEALVANGIRYGIGLIGGLALGYLAAKRVYQRKLRRRTEFLKKSSGSLTERVGSEFEVGFLVFLLSACLWGVIIGLVTRFMPTVGPWLESIPGL